MRVQVAVAALLLTVPVAPGAQALQRLPGSHTDFPLELRRAGEVSSRAERLSRDVAALTGAQLSPLLAIGVLGGVRWASAAPAQRPGLPWHDQPWFWGTALALLLLFWAADKVPALRQAVKPVRLYESKVSGVLAAAALVGAFARDAAAAATPALEQAVGWILPAAQAAEGGLRAEGGATAGVVYGLAWAVGLTVSAAVWLAGHSVHVLSLLNPFAPLDWLLRGVRLLLLAALAVVTAASERLGGAMALVYALLALAMAGWSFRLMVFGALFSSDLLLLRDVPPPARGPLAFSSAGVRGIPRRTLGRVVHREGGAAFTYRPWLVLPARRLALARPEAVGRGWFHAVLIGPGGELAARLPPRYRRRTAEVAAALGVPVVDASPARSLRAALAWLRGEVVE